MARLKRSLLAIACVVALPGISRAQLAPEIGYMHPAGGQAGTTTNVVLGGYDWTPDMQIFVHDPRIKLEITGAPSEVLVPPPPYWFGAKGRGPAWPLPREFPAKLTIPADVPPGQVKFQVANANGASPVGFLHVGTSPAITEDGNRKSPQTIAALPATIDGQIRLIEEIDRYEFTAPKAGPITLELVARQLNSPLHGLLKVHDEQGQAVVDLADTEGRDLAATFIARAGAKYSVSLHDLDYAGDRSYVYRLAITPGSRVLAAYPAAGKRGTTQKIEFLGLGIATGANQLETISRDVSIPAMPTTSFAYVLDTPLGPTRPMELQISDLAEQVEAVGGKETNVTQLPGAITGSIETRFGADRYVVAMKKGDKWRIEAQAREIHSPLDLDLTIFGPDGKEAATNDDAPGTTDPLLLFAPAADGNYTLIFGDRSGRSGNRTANYRLVIEPQRETFELTAPALLPVLLGSQGKLAVKVTRQGTWKGAVKLTLAGLPAGISAPADLTIAEDKADLAIDLTCAADAPATAALVTLSATAMVGDKPVTQTAPVLIAATMKPRIKITPEGLDDVRKVHRGSTFLAPLFVDRLEGYTGEVTLEMTAKQQRHRQGLASGEFVVPPDAKRVEYPIFVPEWMETTKTSRMIVNGVVKVADPKGNIRTLVQKQELRIGILPVGALLKLSAPSGEMPAAPGEEIRVPLAIARAAELREPVTVELVPSAGQMGLVTAEKLTLTPDQREATLAIRLGSDPRVNGDQNLQIRATALQGGKWQVVSDASVLVVVRPAQR